MKRDEILKLKVGDPVIFLGSKERDRSPAIVFLDRPAYAIRYDDLWMYYPATKEGVEQWRKEQTALNYQAASLPEKDYCHISENARRIKQKGIDATADDLNACIDELNKQIGADNT